MLHARSLRELMKLGAFVGIVGGIAEVAWIWCYAALSGANAANVAEAVARAVGAGGAPAPVAFGLIAHMVLAMGLGAGLVVAVAPLKLNRSGQFLVIVAALALVWAVNFLLVLPAIDPSFTQVVPYGASFLSKLLFGASAAATLDLSPLRTNTP